MSLFESIRVAWQGLMSNLFRSLLTVLGVIIGVAAVVALVSVGQGATAQVTAQLEALGSNLIIVSPARGGYPVAGDGPELLRRVPTVVRAAPSVVTQTTVKWGLNTYETSVEGTNGDFLAVRNFEVERGRFLQDADVEGRGRVAVVGQEVVDQLFGGLDALGERMFINGQPFQVVGVMGRKGTAMGRNNDDVVFIPVSTAQRLFRTDRLNALYLQAAGKEVADLAVGHINRIYELKFGREGSVRVQSQDQLLTTVDTMSRTLSLMLGAIAGISLLVGGIGIMNIMLVSVTERTREIGIRKAMGARRRDILAQFLVESVLLSVTGGAIGIVTGIGGSRVVAHLAGWQTLVSPQAVAVAFLFAAAVGITFGLYPAARAAALDPIEALRYE